MSTVSRKLKNRLPLPVVVAMVAATAWLSGCDDTPPVTPKPPTTGTSSACADKLAAALDMLQPDRLGISTEPETAVSLLNDWLESCDEQTAAGGDISDDVKDPLRPVLSPARINGLSAVRFSVRDGKHVRNCFLHRATANLDFPTANSELDRAVELFHYLTRQIAPPTSPEAALPLTPFEIMLFGRGTAKDVAWAFADVLRQLGIDAVILTPARAASRGDAGEGPGDEEQAGGERPWLVGVLTGDEVYLFDPRLASPIPSLADSGKTPTVKQPASLAEARTDGRVFRQLDLRDGQPYPLSAADLRQLKVEVIGTASLWGSATQRLGAELTGDRSAVVYDGLHDGSSGPGLISRVAGYGGSFWRKEDIGIWPYPERQLEASANLDETGRQRLLLMQLPLEAPVPVHFDPQTQQVVIAAPEKGQYKTRILHLLGEYRTAVGNYQKTRIRAIIDPRLPVPPNIRLMHALAEDDALFWLGLCQFEQANYESAGTTFRNYLERYKKQPGGKWLPHCRTMLALSLAEIGDWDEAVFMLEDAELAMEEQKPGPALRQRYDFWKHRWSAAAKTMNDER